MVHHFSYVKGGIPSCTSVAFKWRLILKNHPDAWDDILVLELLFPDCQLPGNWYDAITFTGPLTSTLILRWCGRQGVWSWPIWGHSLISTKQTMNKINVSARPVVVYRRFGCACYLHIQSGRPDDGGSMQLWNIVKRLPDYHCATSQKKIIFVIDLVGFVFPIIHSDPPSALFVRIRIALINTAGCWWALCS
jgi:hypothetical protein